MPHSGAKNELRVAGNTTSPFSNLRMGTVTLHSVTNHSVIAEDDLDSTELPQNAACLTLSEVAQSVGIISLIITLYPCGHSVT